MKKLLILLGCLTILSLFAYLFLIHGKSSESETVAKIENVLLPIVIENKIIAYIDTDWCQAIHYGDRIVQRLKDPDSNSYCLDNSQAFASDDETIFNKIRDSIVENDLNINRISYEYPLRYRQEHESLPETSFGISFSLNCAFCGVRYLYATNTIEFINIDREISYTRVNNKWYIVNQDPL
ncbi:MAG: hypothetical protein MUF19_03605 [Candidatus Pacebacteria bacterium]|jgi:hypothetical protein|nr:hypothetical protein [Candidatus Paceibacterota bacterium]